MKKIITTYFILLGVTSFAQNSKTLEGYYNLSEFEMPAHLYLLDNGQFYYFAIFGVVDLEIYGAYTIENNNIRFHPKKEQLQPFGLYGRKNKTLKNEIEFFYYLPDEDYRFNLLFSLDDNWVQNTKKQESENEVYFKTKRKHLKTLKIGYPALFNKNGNYFKIIQTYKARVPNKNNSFVLTFNRYYAMRKQFADAPMLLDGENIVKGEEIIKKQEISKEEVKKIITFINNHKLFSDTIDIKAEIYKKITQTVGERNIMLNLNPNGKITEFSPSNNKNWKQINNEYYTISYPENWINDIYTNDSLDYNMISSPENISGVEIVISDGNLTDLENMIKELRDKSKEMMPNIDLKIKKKSTHHLKYELKAKDKDKEVSVLARYYFKNNKIIKIIAHNIPKHKSITAKMLKSFKLK